ncbi:hypothetical protein B0H14DRAFT_3490933 [Mycena olivaceomarginata]|nr:hypothetical protein B0H14DRAFT_3490933 [Mycena olivaceomarginata]
MKLSISGLVALAIAAPALGAVVARIEGDVTSDVVPGKWLSIKQGITYHNSTDVVPRAGPIVTCYGSGTKADRAPIISVIDDWCGVIGTSVANNQEVWARYDYGTFTVRVSGKAINNCGGFTIDGNCNRLLRLPVDRCNTGGVNGKQGGYETDLCGQWTTDPGSNGSDN